MNPYQYCQQQVAPVGSNLHYSLLFADPAQRQLEISLYAFSIAVHHIGRECQDPQVARLKLNWWRSELQNMIRGTATHPITQALAPLLPEAKLPFSLFESIVNQAETELEAGLFATYNELQSYFYQSPDIIKIIASQVLATEPQAVLGFAHDIAWMLYLCRQLIELRANLQAGYIFLPQDELTGYGISLEILSKLQMSPALRKLLQAYQQRILTSYQKALSQLPDTQRWQQCSLIILAELHLAQLQQIADSDFNVLQTKVELTPLRKLWLAWRIKQRETKYAKCAGGKC